MDACRSMSFHNPCRMSFNMQMNCKHFVIQLIYGDNHRKLYVKCVSYVYNNDAVAN